MNQRTQSLLLEPAHDAAATAADLGVDRTGFRIGWDHAHHGLVPPAGLLIEGTPVGQGWRAGRAVFGGRTLTATRWARSWLALRMRAWREGVAFEEQQVTPNFLSQIHVDRCPVLRVPLGGAPGQPEAAVVDRINPQAGYAAGNLVQVSERAAQARRGVDAVQALRLAQRAAVDQAPVDGLDSAQWRRLAALRAFATPLPLHEVARIPLALLPPNRVRLLNAPQGLQALLTLQFATPGWAQRTRAIAELLPSAGLRHDHSLLVGAIAARVIEKAGDNAARREALEDVWLHDRVQRRWEQLVLGMGQEATASLVEAAAARGLAGVRMVVHEAALATEGWALESAGRRSTRAAAWRTGRTDARWNPARQAPRLGSVGALSETRAAS